MSPNVISRAAPLRRAKAVLFYQHLAERDWDAIARMLAPDVMVHSPVVGRGRDLALEAAKRCFAADEDVPPQPEPTFAVVDGTTVTTCYAMPQTQPDGSTIDFFWMDTVRVENERIVEWWPSINDAAPTQLSWIPPTQPSGAPSAGADRDAMKKIAVDFYRYVFDSEDASAVGRYVTDDYLQHSRHMPSGRVGLEALVSSIFPDGPRETPDQMTLVPTVLAAEGDIVVQGGTLRQRSGAGAATTTYYPYIVYDAYRIRNGKIAEHWSGVNPAAPPIHGDSSPEGEEGGPAKP